MASISPLERRSIASIGLLFALRMLGMFMVVPVLAMYGTQLTGSSPLLIGVAIGVYGLAQALCQIPFGLWSDRIGRRPVIMVGLLLMFVGSILPAFFEHIGWLILGRFLQGAGAISAVLMALLSDLTREQYRSLGMAIIGMSFGVTFALAIGMGPWLAAKAGIHAVFGVIAVLAILAFICLLVWVPEARQQRSNREAEVIPAAIRRVFQTTGLMRLNLGIFMLHLLLMLSFQALPTALRAAGYVADLQWQPMLTAMLTSMLMVIPLMLGAERFQRIRWLYLSSIIVMALAEVLWFYATTQWLILAALIAFFLAFNLLEALLPSMVSKMAPVGLKGTAMGVYSTAQFLGLACGGGLGGVLAQYCGASALYLAAMSIALIWWIVSRKMLEPATSRSLRLEFDSPLALSQSLYSELMAQPGVLAAELAPEEGCAYLKIDPRRTCRGVLMAWISAQSRV